jgi:hypothetical protein
MKHGRIVDKKWIRRRMRRECVVFISVIFRKLFLHKNRFLGSKVIA